MRVSFDIDDTLVCRSAKGPPEPGHLPAVFCRWFGEPLRRGTCSLIRELRRRGCSIWIYTTSERTPFQIRLWLFLYGIHVNGVVNGERHRRELPARGFARLPSKYPPAFGIDLHVDDSDGVRMEGEQHGFSVVIIQPNDDHWAGRVLAALDGCTVRSASKPLQATAAPPCS